MRIEYSKLASLNVRYNNDKSRDYTNPSLPTGDPGLVDPFSVANAAAAFGQGLAGHFGNNGGGIGNNGTGLGIGGFVGMDFDGYLSL